MKFLIFLTIFIISSFSYADDSTEELLTLWKIDSEWEVFMKDINASVVEPLDWMVSESSDMEELLLHDKYKSLLTQEIDKYLNLKSFKKFVENAIDQIFTEKEKLELIAFYETNTGKKLLNSESKLKSLAETHFQKKLKPMQKSISQLMENYQKEHSALNQ